eukprot:8775455-Pyramimonas_sp.AAC.1
MFPGRLRCCFRVGLGAPKCPIGAIRGSSRVRGSFVQQDVQASCAKAWRHSRFAACNHMSHTIPIMQRARVLLGTGENSTLHAGTVYRSPEALCSPAALG